MTADTTCAAAAAAGCKQQQTLPAVGRSVGRVDPSPLLQGWRIASH